MPRLQLWYGFLLLVFAVIIIRLFYLQIIQHNYYRTAALSGQLKEYQIPAERGIIQAKDGDQIVPIVLNENVYTVFADPVYIKDATQAASQLAGIIGGDVSKYTELMKANSRYSVLAKKIPESKAKQIDNLEIKGLGTRSVSQRVYPQGSMAAQLLGFVDDDGNGKYGIEQYLDSELRGKPGELKAITDAQGVPLVANRDNVLTDPENGKRVTLTVDISMQRRVEDLLKKHLAKVRSDSGSIVIMDPNSGEIKAMASYPTYNPAEFYKVADPSVFTNSVVSQPIEVGSVMKTLTVAAGIDTGVIGADTTFYDPGYYKIGDATVKDVEEDGGAGTRSVADILKYSLNTGATWILMQMGGGQINEQARVKWHDYLTNHYMFGKQTGVEQGYEAAGYVPSPTDGFGLDITYANTAFGQGLNITPLQMLAAFSATVNGGNYWRPHLISQEDNSKNLVKAGAIKPELSPVIRGLHERTVNNNYTFLKRDGYHVGGKTGTAQIPKPGGGYYDDRYYGTFVGFVGGNKPEYVIMVTVNNPRTGTYAGISGAAPLFEQAEDMLISNYAVNMATH